MAQQKHKYHLKGIGGRPSKQMKELQGKPLPMCMMKPIKEVVNGAVIGEIWLDEAEEVKCLKNPKSRKKSKVA